MATVPRSRGFLPVCQGNSALSGQHLGLYLLQDSPKAGQRIQVPLQSKFGLYKCSGLHSVQFRAVMEANSPPEKGLELIPLKGEPLILSKEFAKLARIDGHLGVFKTQHQTFFRVEDECLAAARQAIYGSDERFSDWKDIGKADARSQGRSFRGERGSAQHTHHEVQQLSAHQNQGFERLMDAIAGLRASSSASNTPIPSPPHKGAKGS